MTYFLAVSMGVLLGAVLMALLALSARQCDQNSSCSHGGSCPLSNTMTDQPRPGEGSP